MDARNAHRVIFNGLKWAAGIALCSRLLTADEIPDATQSAAPPAQPLAAWNCSSPPGIDPGEQLSPTEVSLRGSGTNDDLKTIHILPPQDSNRANQCKIFWTQGSDGKAVLSLASDMLHTVSPPSERAARLEMGSTSMAPIRVQELTLCLRFRLTAPMCFGGVPTCEMDGKLISLSPVFSVGILGSGSTGRGERRIYIDVQRPMQPKSRYEAVAGSGIKIGPWTSLMVSWESGSDLSGLGGIKLWLNEKSISLKTTGPPTDNGPLTLAGPFTLGGDGSYSAVPMDLEGFAIYDQRVEWKDAFDGEEAAFPAEGSGLSNESSKGYHLLHDLAGPDAWKVSDDDLTLSKAADDILAVGFEPSTLGKKRRLMLKQGIAIKDEELLQFWYCMPALVGPEAGHSVQAVFSDPSGTEFIVHAVDSCNTHVSPPNARACGLWQTLTVGIPPDKGPCQFQGFEIDYQSGSPYPLPRYLYFGHFGLDKIDYAKSNLYYVVANYRDNFSIVGLNVTGSRALTDESGESPVPYLLLDNGIDQAKDGRPAVVNLEMECFDSSDRLVWSGLEKSLDASDVLSMYHKLPIPITNPGTYRIRSKSYNSQTGEYFTTEWTQLIIVRGQAMALPTGQALRRGLLYINPDKPFGRLDKGDPLRINFVVRDLPAGGAGPAVLKYEIIPYDEWVPHRDASRNVPLTKSIPILKPGTITIPYQPNSSVELVMAELWVDGRKMDRDERLIGVRNDLSSAPPQTAAIPGIEGLSRLNGGLLINSHFDSLLDRSGDQALQVFTDNLDEVKKISPLVEFIPSIERLEPIPGVYDWDYLQKFFDACKAHGCSLVLYLMQKWPPSWAPVDFLATEGQRIHHTPVVWTHLVGAYNYSTGETGPEIIRTFNQQLARRFVNEPGFAAYYPENEHILASGPNSYDNGNATQFHKYLANKYQMIANLNSAYGTAYGSFDEVRLPTSNIAAFPRKIMFVDWAQYRGVAAEAFTLNSQFDAFRKEDPRRPILVYTLGSGMSEPFLEQIASQEGLITNGGVHSVLDSDVYREQFCAVPGLLERMEPHDVFHYEPFPHGFDEMIFGMLGLGGRGMNFHFIVNADPYQKFSYQAYCDDVPTGYGLFLKRLHAVKELRTTEKLHDPVAVVQLKSLWDYCLGTFNFPIRKMMEGIYVHNHYEPKVYQPGMNIRGLNGVKIIFVTGELIDKTETDYLVTFARQGGDIVLDDTAASVSFENPDDPDNSNYLLRRMGIDSSVAGTQIPGVPIAHDVYKVGSGNVALVRGKDLINRWNGLTPAFMAWAKVKNSLATSDDPYMQMHTLRGPDADYLAMTHRGYDQNAYNGPREWSGQVRYVAPSDPGSKFEVSQIWADEETPLGIMTAEQLAHGIDVGHFDEMELKVLKIKPVK